MGSCPIAIGETTSKVARDQLPLALCSVITMLKSQKQRVEEVGMDLGMSKTIVKLTFVGLSQAKLVVDLFVESMPFHTLLRLRLM